MLRQFTVLFALVALLSSCGGDSDKRENNEAKKVFRYNQAEGLTSLDPAFARNQANIWAANQIYNGLFELDHHLNVVPCLVDTWNASEDNKTYTFHIRKGIHFHDSEVFPDGKGRELKAEDFVYSFKRILDPATSSTGAWIFNDKILKNVDGSVSDTSFKAVDDYTLKIYLNKPFPPILQILSMPYTYVVPKEAVEKYGKDFRTKPVGTGPFTFKQWTENESLTLLRNNNYWRKDASGNNLPYLDAVQVSFISDKNQAFRTFEQGKLDFVSGIEEASRDLVLNRDGSVKKEFAAKYQVSKVPYLNTEYLGFQMDPSLYKDKKHPFLDRRVRQAMNYAINKVELVGFLRNKLGIPGVSGMVPVVLPSFDSTKVKGYTYNLEKAQQLLKEAGYPQGKGFPEVTLNSNNLHNELCEYLQKQWSSLGINVKIDINNNSTHQELVDNGRVHLFRASWLGDYPDAENYLSMFYSKNMSPAGPNKTRFKNEKFDELFEKAQVVDNDPFDRYEMYNLMDQIVMTEAPVIVLYYDEVLRMAQPNVTGLEANPMNNLSLERVDFKSTVTTAAVQ
ncbi:ABC transporter substrate-binding protein [Rhodocytophaga aerolata]|uniref:ABC transporter substrate-binding protein n=1 Tax=Rhodocytophaga aerolata TaxID=455078 RepID=A0ABT8R3V8_9BACT|nr:ABC transporter substrate-binding protein [Rhodocytophaga aerolata]MDO1446079.1 ABC transporter substrate-binding protein [Rhodocytophaga aerolata]